MSDLYRLRPLPPRIIVEEREGHWTAWFEHRPEAAFGGSTPTEAVFRLTGPHKDDEKQQSWRERPPLL